MMASMAALLEKSHAILAKIRDATARGIIRWERCKDPTEFVGHVWSEEFFLKFKYPAYNADEGSDNDFVAVYAFGAGRRFMAGTEGWHLAGEILAAAFPDYRDHL